MLDALTGLRAFAALHVVAYHFLPQLGGSPLMDALEAIRKSGDNSVTLFFVLSGFVLVYVEAGQGVSIKSWKQFYLRRCARIAPCYVFAMALAAPNVLTSDHSPWLIAKSFVLTLTTLQTWVPGNPFGVWNFPAYTIGIEVAFYLLFPVLFQQIMTLDRRSLVYVMAIAWSLACAGDVFFFLARDLLLPNPHALPPYRIPVFIVGMLFGRIFVMKEMVLSPRKATIVSIVAVASVLLAYVLFSKQLPWARQVLIPLFGILVFACATNEGPIARGLMFRPIVILGEISYGIYIFQAPVLACWLVRGSLDTSFAFVLYLVSLIAVSYASYRWLEEPIRRSIRWRQSMRN